MRKKGPIWDDKYQSLIVERYLDGMVIDEIRRLPEIDRFSPSAFTIREILKANNVRPTWKKRKRKPEVWQTETIDRVLVLRNTGMPITAITEKLAEESPELDLSRSTVVRILDEHADRVTYRPRMVQGGWSPEVVQKVVSMYLDGMLIKEIVESDVFGDRRITQRTVRALLKSEGVKLTAKKGSLRRWPEGLQRKVVDLYQEGRTFAEIKQDAEIATNNPTDYAIRNILRKHGISTRSGTSYREPIVAARYRRYVDGRMTAKEVSLVHKHLARVDEGRERMVERMGIVAATSLPDDDEACVALKGNVENWRRFYDWAIRYLYDDELKRDLFILGAEFGKRIQQLKSVYAKGDEEAELAAWEDLDETVRKLKIAYNNVLREPIRASKLSRFAKKLRER